MDLLSGLIGALIASILTIIYLYLVDKIKFRENILLEIIDYLENIYHRLQTIHSLKKILFTDKQKIEINHKNIYEELAFLLKTSSPHAKLRLAYGEGKELQKLNYFSTKIREVSLILFNTNEETWGKNDSNILSIISKVEIQKNLLINYLFDGLSIVRILEFKFFGIVRKFNKGVATDGEITKNILKMRFSDINKLLDVSTGYLSDVEVNSVHEQIDIIMKIITENEKLSSDN
ncbi:MAG: hypothetical protein H0U71_05105 [Gammaproteobacteria bacterium]|nr:hypothetical protein [Gammaproteobacteria bacterium]